MRSAYREGEGGREGGRERERDSVVMANFIHKKLKDETLPPSPSRQKKKKVLSLSITARALSEEAAVLSKAYVQNFHVCS